MSHGDLDSRLAKLCRLLDLKHYHTHRSDKSNPGFPDWVIAGEIALQDRVVYAELKTDDDRVKDDQAKWIDALRRAGERAYIVRGTEGLDVLERLLTAPFENYFIRDAQELSRRTSLELEKFKKKGII